MEAAEEDGKRGGDAELFTSLRDSSVSSVEAGDFGCSSNCRCFVDADAAAAFFPFVLKEGTFFIKLFMMNNYLCLHLLLLLIQLKYGK